MTPPLPELPRPLAPLPVRLRPHAGEITDSYVRRLARANHLKPSYLHCFLNGPPFWFGKPQLDRLAAVSGRSEESLDRALADASSPRGRIKPNPRTTRTELFADDPNLPLLIYIDARRGHTIQDLALRHEVPRRLVRLALDTMQPPPRGVDRSYGGFDSDLIKDIRTMANEGLGPKQMWLRLMDEYEVSVSYTMLRRFVRQYCPRRHNAAKGSPRSPLGHFQ
ncbi:hypothetical protein [Streptomyces sp. NPDC057557]|uniref:hypothetical protein n=1 Tax=Streptomyces sp. NPDC057557 TaxID=3346167 RepID=UPI0036BA3278